MTRLVAFGCSFTYGHGLPDCTDGTSGYGPNPSNAAWPKLLADKLDYTVVNMGKPGAGNTEILWRLLNFKFEVDDVCVIMWSYFSRSDFFRYSDNGEGIKFKRNHRIVEEDDKVYKENNNITNLLAISHAEYYLADLNILSYACVGPYRANSEMILGGEFDFTLHDGIKITNLDLSFSLSNYMVDSAMDGIHPGIRSHRLIAERLYDNLNVIR
jgi:hypothetical protein